MVIAAYSSFKVFGSGFASPLLLIYNIWVISAAPPTVTQIFTYTGAPQTFTISNADISNGYNTILFKLFGAGAQDKIINGNFLGMGGSGGQVITLKLLLHPTTSNNI
jgi:hypothetical protein